VGRRAAPYHHLGSLRDLALAPALLRRISITRLHALARITLTARAQTLVRIGNTRRIATLYATLHILIALAHDTILDLLDEVFTTLLTEATKAGTQMRICILQDLDAAALDLADVGAILLDLAVPNEGVCGAVEKRLLREALEQTVAKVRTLARPPADTT
jgi:hypothetical protein